MKLFIFLLGFGLSVMGCIYIISYLNLFSIGYTFLEYIDFITKRVECWYAVVGLLLISFTIFGGKKDEIHI